MKSIVLVVVLMLSTTFAFAADLGGNQFLKISGYDQQAVVKTPSGEMRIVAVGDAVGPTYTVADISAKQVVLEAAGISGAEKLIVHLDKNGQQKIDRMGQIFEDPRQQ